MSFETYGVGQNESSGGNKVDFDELNKYVVEKAGLEQRDTLVGYVSMLVDLGTQDQPDSEVVFTGTEEDERKEVAQYPATYFKDGIDPQTKKQVRFKCWPNKPVQCVAIAVDFPDIILDKGSFFGESKPLPLRLWLGGQFYTEGAGMVIGRPTPLKVNKKLGDWSLDQKNIFHRMAVAAKLIQPNEVFVPQRIGELLGKAFQFEAQVFFKKNKGKSYYTEYVKFVSGLGRGQKEPELLTTPMMVQFYKENPEDAIKELRAHVVNTIKRASNYDESNIKKQLVEIGRVKEGEESTPDDGQEEEKKESPPQSKAKPKQSKPEPDFDSFDPDIPF